MTASLVPAVIPRTPISGATPAGREGPRLRPLPLAALPPDGTRPADSVYALTAVDKSGRVAARGILADLGWRPGTRLDIREQVGVITVRVAGEGGCRVARLFIGPLAPLSLLDRERLPVVPGGPRLRVQGVHADDVAEAYVRAAVADVRGAFNLAADPVLDGPALARRYQGRVVPVPVPALRAAAAVTWLARLQPVEPGWIDLATGVPLLSSARAATELGWTPRIDALEAIAELFTGMAEHAGAPSPALRERPPALARMAAMLAGRLPGHGDPY